MTTRRGGLSYGRSRKRFCYRHRILRSETPVCTEELAMRQAFTLIELLIVVAIIGILAAIA
ncbi:MAG TPA: prepilin-type N-terminal cleavage/methylation domain-containing protein, partial [bacterium]|nr:prepilin-type N-terminal cleavage/methylation domain-containing protein [bacterium]